MKALLDTCVFIDQVCRRTPFDTEANKVFSLALMGKVELAVLPMTFATCYYIGLRNKIPANILLSAFNGILPYLSIAHTNSEALSRAINSEWKDFEDAMQYHTALDVAADCVITRNKKDFEGAKIPVYTPAEFLKAVGVES